MEGIQDPFVIIIKLVVVLFGGDVTIDIGGKVTGDRQVDLEI